MTGNLDKFFSVVGPARYDYQLKCELRGSARLRRLAIVNDLQMAPMTLPEMVVGENHFAYSDQSSGDRKVRITHQWVERSASRPPPAPPAPIYPPDAGEAEASCARCSNLACPRLSVQRPCPQSGITGLIGFKVDMPAKV